MATISLALSATLTWPSTRRWRAAKAETMWIGAGAVSLGVTNMPIELPPELLRAVQDGDAILFLGSGA